LERLRHRPILARRLESRRRCLRENHEADPKNPTLDNIGRFGAGGDTAEARKVLEKSLAIDSRLARTNFFYARVLKEDGDYEARSLTCGPCWNNFRATASCATSLAASCSSEALRRCGQEFEQTLSIDPEDLQAHYNLMLCYNGLGDDAKATNTRRATCVSRPTNRRKPSPAHTQTHPEDNNERQAIHEHISVALAPAPRGKSPAPKAAAKRRRKMA